MKALALVVQPGSKGSIVSLEREGGISGCLMLPWIRDAHGYEIDLRIER